MQTGENYNIAVIGPIPKDHITTHKGEVIQKYGCVTHPVIALSKLTDGNANIYPITHVRKKDVAEIKDLLSQYPGIELEGIGSESDQGDVIRLKFLDQNNRVEKQTGFMNPITQKDLQDFLHCDVYVFVPVSDFEISLDALKYLKQNSKGTIIFDAHGPTNSVSISGDRFKKFWIDRDLWLPYIDVLKMNLEEAYCSWFPRDYDGESTIESEKVDDQKLRNFAKHCLKAGVKAIFITLDERGCMLYTNKEGEYNEELIPPVKVAKVIDTTGAGDSFAGGLAFGLLENRLDFQKAGKYANAIGAQRTQGSTFEVFKSKEETDKMILDNYGID